MKEKAIVLGLSGKIPELVEAERANADEVPLIRRYSGGGTVLVDSNTIFCSIIMNVRKTSAISNGYDQTLSIYRPLTLNANLFLVN
jgi:lipoate---protein ligase